MEKPISRFFIFLSVAMLVLGGGAILYRRVRTLERLVSDSNFTPSSSDRIRDYLAAVKRLTIADPPFAITVDAKVLFSAASGGRYLLGIWNPLQSKASVLEAQTRGWDHYYPVRLGERWLSLAERLGDYSYRVEGFGEKELNGIPSKMRLFGSPKNDLVLLITLGRNETAHLFRANEHGLLTVGKKLLEGSYQGHQFSSDERFLLVGSDRSLLLWNLQDGSSALIGASVTGEKAGPAFDWERRRIYFASSGTEEYREIFALDFNDLGSTLAARGEPYLLHKSEHDKNHLAVSGDFLYFIENVRNEYLLTRFSLSRRVAEPLTHDGVVYRFDLLASEHLVATQARADSPSHLVVIEPGRGQASPADLAADPRISVGQPSWLQPEGLSSAWVFMPPREARGVVLSIHGGPQIDVSPRWDPYFQLFLEMGLGVVAPNYPGSRGYGKSFQHASQAAALADLLAWARWINQKYPARPQWIEGLSYGALLAEQLLHSQPSLFQGAILRSGLPARGFEPSSSTPPLLFLLSRYDYLVHYSQRLHQLEQWASAFPGKIFFRGYGREGHLLVENAALADSLESCSWFIEREKGADR